MCFGTLCTHALSTFGSHSQGQSYYFLSWTVSAAQEDVISQISCAEAMESSDYQAEDLEFDFVFFGEIVEGAEH